MNSSWLRLVILLNLLFTLCLGLLPIRSSFSQGNNRAGTQRSADKSDETRRELQATTPETPSRDEEPRLAIPPRMAVINPSTNLTTAAASNSIASLSIPAVTAPQTLTTVKSVAERSDLMTNALETITPEPLRGDEEPHLTEPPRMLTIRPPLSPAPSAPGLPQLSNFEQMSEGPDLQTEMVSSFSGISHGETIVPGLRPPNNTFIVRTAPPDTVGAVGEDYYVQWVNYVFAVFKKSTGELKYGPALGNTLWKNFDGGPCEKSNDGDPMVQYDKINKRWIMAQFVYGKRVLPNGRIQAPVPPYYQCIAVSTTSNPLGTYRRFRFRYTLFNDYPKLGVWTDGYYITFNMFDDPKQGAMVCAYDQDAMLGKPAQPGANSQPRVASQQCVQLDNRYLSLLPADIDGRNPPPAGAPNYLASLDPNNRAINLWRFKLFWGAQAANSRLTGPISIAGGDPYDVPCPSVYRLTCIQQPGTNQLLETLADRLMYRLAYRHFSNGQESLLLNHTISRPVAGGGGVAAIRWYEVRDPGGTPTVYQSGTFSPDNNNRWIGSMAMDRLGNIGMAYSVSSSSLAPSIYYTGHSVDDSQKGRMGNEVLIARGGGSQNCLLPNGQCDPACTLSSGACFINISRWGDYSSLSVDPVDDCTLWYTNEYLKSTGGLNWSTKIYSFRFRGCTQ